MRLSPPAIEPVDLTEAKAHLNIFGSDDDALLARLILSAVASLDGPYGDLGRCLISQRWRLTLDAFPSGAIVIPMPPTISVETLSYFDSSGVETTEQLDATGDSPPATSDNFHVTGLGSDSKARIESLNGWPSTYPRSGVVNVEFTAGYGTTDSDVPEDVRNLILARVAAAYAVRESTVIGIQQGANAETDAVLDRYRTRAF